MSVTKAVITALNAVPITTATARSSTFPLVMNVLNSSKIEIETPTYFLFFFVVFGPLNVIWLYKSLR